MSETTVRLDDLCLIEMGQSPESSSYNTDGNGMPFFQGNADFGEVSPQAKTWCTSPKKVAEAGDLLISVRAPVGALNIADRACCIGRGLAAIRPNPDLVSSRYLWHFLAYIRPRIESRGTGSTFKAVNKKELRSIPVPVRPVEAQRAIAGQLDAISRTISERARQLQRLDDLVKSRFASEVAA